jgi:hypothetical protein
MDAVLHYRDGHTERVRVAPIDPGDEIVTVRGDDPRTVPLASLKAVFYQAQGEPSEVPPGSDIAVEFADGEIIRGVAQYKAEQNGFYLFPVDRSRNDRIFVVKEAIFSIEVEKF